VRRRQASTSSLSPSRIVASISSRSRRGSRCNRIIVVTRTGPLVIRPNDVAWIAADDYYAAVHVGMRRYLVRESLTSLARRLDSSMFIRVHRSAIVNLDHVRELRMLKWGGLVVLADGTAVRVSRRRREAFRSALKSIHHSPTR
jgi:two-component system, LytTR family, response regulator